MFGIKNKDTGRNVLLPLVIMGGLAFISTYVVFFGQYFDSSADGLFHLSRFESVYQALAAGAIPGRLNFIGFNHQGAIVTGMYPWISSLIFILPRFIAEPFMALAIGFFIMNFLTMWFTWLLIGRVTNQRLLQWLGVILYQFNGYHFIVMYTRVAIGEAIGYMAIPLVLLGLIDIWAKRKWGWLTLGIGMAILANGHMLSLVLGTIMVSVFELYRLITKKIDWAEIKQFVQGAIVAIALSAYSLITILQIVSQNSLRPPTVRWNTFTLDNYLWVTLTNDFKEYRDTTMGLVIGIIMIVFLVLATKAKDGEWRKWIFTSNGIFLCCFNFILGPALVNTVFGTIQFSMRFLMFAGLFLAVGIVMYFNDRVITATRKRWIWIMMVTVTLGSLVGMIQHDRQNYSYLTRVTPENYMHRIEDNPTKDYVLMDKSFRRGEHDFLTREGGRAIIAATMYDTSTKDNFTYKNCTFDSVTWAQDTKIAGFTKIPVIGYAGVEYFVTVNGASAKYERKEGHIFVDLKTGVNEITISAR